MISYILLVLIQITAFFSVFSNHKKTVALLVWIAGLLQGVVFLVNGSEILALFQWIQASVFGLLVLIYLLVLGEDGETPRFQWSKVVAPVLLSAGFGYTIYSGLIGSGVEPSLLNHDDRVLRLGEVGKEIMQKHFLLVPALSLFSLLAIIGVGQITRPEEASK